MISTAGLPPVVDMVLYAAMHNPTRPALIQEDRVLNYDSLHKQTNQIAHYLRALDIGPGDRVGIFIERSIDFTIAALGILKCGAAYVPLDPSYPEIRRRLICQDAGLRLILCRDAAEKTTASPTMLPLRSPEVLAEETTDLQLPKLDPEQLAYVIYTSGSTGVPKGVEVTHGNLCHLVSWHRGAFGVTSDDRATLLANVGFDAAVWELWPYLSAGATLLIPPPEVIRAPEVLRDWIVRSQVTIMFAPTLLAEALMQCAWPEDAGLRYLLTGGDALRISPQSELPFRVVNNYGPAECTVVSTSGEIAPCDRGCEIPSIGRPIAGAHVYLLDDELQEVPAGSPGEICIGGGGVARGYLNRPDLTAQRFITCGQNGQRLYRSGDLGCMNPDGSLQFRGRMDEQVKIRGYRIELGEIEAALNSLTTVQTSAVTIREQRAGHMSLVGYLVPNRGKALSHDELRKNLRALLPEYMIPEQFVQLCKIPVNENGKIDRRELPSPTEENIIANANVAVSPVELKLFDVLAKLLKVDQIGREDDFFLLGGHSFIAAQLIARIRDSFGVELNLRAVFEHPTIAGIAQQIQQRISVQLDPVEG